MSKPTTLRITYAAKPRTHLPYADTPNLRLQHRSFSLSYALQKGGPKSKKSKKSKKKASKSSPPQIPRSSDLLRTIALQGLPSSLTKVTSTLRICALDCHSLAKSTESQNDARIISRLADQLEKSAAKLHTWKLISEETAKRDPDEIKEDGRKTELTGRAQRDVLEQESEQESATDAAFRVWEKFLQQDFYRDKTSFIHDLFVNRENRNSFAIMLERIKRGESDDPTVSRILSWAKAADESESELDEKSIVLRGWAEELLEPKELTWWAVRKAWMRLRDMRLSTYIRELREEDVEGYQGFNKRTQDPRMAAWDLILQKRNFDKEQKGYKSGIPDPIVGPPNVYVLQPDDVRQNKRRFLDAKFAKRSREYDPEKDGHFVEYDAERYGEDQTFGYGQQDEPLKEHETEKGGEEGDEEKLLEVIRPVQSGKIQREIWRGGIPSPSQLQSFQKVLNINSGP